jgi:hypothetical protein
MIAAGVIPPLILANSALKETVGFLRETDVITRGNANRSLREEIEYASGLKLTELAIECLRTACAARDLMMVVIDPDTQLRHAVPAEYFDQRPAADAEFVRGLFGAYELPEITVSDPLFKLVRSYRGWVHGFVEPEFRAWLVNPESGPQAGPRMRPFFHVDPRAASADVKERKKPGPRPVKIEHCKVGMLADLTEKRRTVEQLQSDTLEALRAGYGPDYSLNTVGKARDLAISEFQSSNSEKTLNNS